MLLVLLTRTRHRSSKGIGQDELGCVEDNEHDDQRRKTMSERCRNGASSSVGVEPAMAKLLLLGH